VDIFGDIKEEKARDLCSLPSWTTVGDRLEEFCALHHLNQHVKEPTRGSALLDLVISDFDNVRAITDPPLGRSDHAVVVTDITTSTVREPRTRRQVWRYCHADWDRMNAHLNSLNWDALLSKDVDTNCSNVANAILAAMNKFIPSKLLVCRPSDPPWWSPECTDAVKAKQRAWKNHRRNSTSPQAEAAYKLACSYSVRCLRDARAQHLTSVRAKLKTGSLRDKQWWSAIKQAGGHGRTPDGKSALCTSQVT